MASVNNGDQLITFRYQQEGTAEGFNQILNGVLPRGIISGGTLIRDSDTKVAIAQGLEMLIGDNDVIVHVKTRDVANVTVSPSTPYIIAKFSWVNMANNYVSFEASPYNDLPLIENALIIGKCEYTGTVMSDSFDYSRKSWALSHYDNQFLFSNSYKTRSPSFNVTSNESTSIPSLAFTVGAGNAIINGKYVEFLTARDVSLTTNPDNQDSPLYFKDYVKYNRIDLIIITADGTIEYIMGEDMLNPVIPTCPCYGLPIATVTFGSGTGISAIKGSQIKYIFNNNYIGLTSSVGKKSGISIINEHTLYL